MAGDKFRDATVAAESATDSFELEDEGTGDGGSNLRDNLKIKRLFTFQISMFEKENGLPKHNNTNKDITCIDHLQQISEVPLYNALSVSNFVHEEAEPGCCNQTADNRI